MTTTGPTTKRNSISSTSLTSSPRPSSSAIGPGFHLRISSASNAAAGKYGFLSYGGKLGGGRGRSDFYVVDFTASVVKASLFSLTTDSHLVSGNYTAALPYAARNATVQFLPTNNTDMGQGVIAYCAVAIDRTLGCTDQTNSHFYLCGNDALKIGTGVPANCEKIVLFKEPASGILGTTSMLPTISHKIT